MLCFHKEERKTHKLKFSKKKLAGQLLGWTDLCYLNRRKKRVEQAMKNIIDEICSLDRSILLDEFCNLLSYFSVEGVATCLALSSLSKSSIEAKWLGYSCWYVVRELLRKLKENQMPGTRFTRLCATFWCVLLLGALLLLAGCGDYKSPNSPNAPQSTPTQGGYSLIVPLDREIVFSLTPFGR